MAPSKKIKSAPPIGTKIPYEPYRLKSAEFRDFVLGVVDNRFFTTAHLTEQDLEMVGAVFMPLSFGAFELPSEWLTDLPPQPSDKPAKLTAAELKAPGKPDDHPLLPDAPTKPHQPPGVQTREKIMQDIEWGRVPAKTPLPFAEEWEVYQVDLDEYLGVVLPTHEAAMADIIAKHKEEVDSYAQTMATWDASVAEKIAANEAGIAQWDEINRVYQEAFNTAKQEYTQNIALLYEETAAAAHRSAKGLPMFMSMRVLAREDWERAVPLIQQEIERREKLVF